MAQPKLAKLTRPRTEGLLRRERLFALLDEARGQSLIWIAAPPGAGKTSLVSSYLEARKVPTLWYQLDGGDADPASFFYYLGLAAMEFMPGNIKSLPLFTQEFTADVVGFARRFFRELYAVLPDGSILVLDNYQEVPERSQLHALIDTALAELPDARLICGISRSDVPSELVRWRAAQRVTIVDFQALKLNADEAIRIGRAHSDLDDSALKALHEQTDGWAAGMILMAERLRQTGQTHQGARSTNLETVFDYFAGQILNALPEAIGRLLIRMSYLPRLTAETAQAITGDPEAVRLLTDLAKRNLFTDRRYGEDVSFQFHALFRAFLQEQASEQLGASEHRKVAHSAAALLQATGQVEDAFPLFASVGAWDSAAALVRKQADRLVRQGRRQTLRQWIGMLPMASVEQDAWLLYWLGVCSLGVDHEKAHELLIAAFDRFAADADGEGQVISASTAAESYFSMRVGWNGLDVWIDRLALLLLQDEPTVSEPTLVRGTIALARSMFYRQTERRELGRLIEVLVGYLGESRDPNDRVAAAAIVVGYNWMYGNGDVCDRMVAAVGPLVDHSAVTASNRSFFYFWWICLEYSQGDLEESALLVGRAKQVWDELGLSPMAVEFERLGTAVQILQGDYRKAREILEAKVAPFMSSARPVARSFYHIHMAICDLGEGQPAGARKHLDEAMTVVRTLGYTLADVMNNHLTGLVLAAEGRFDEADRSLLEHRDRVRCWGNRTVESFTTACRALVLLRRGSTEAALAELRVSLSAIEGAQCLWAQHISVSLLAELFAFALVNDTETMWVREFIRKRGFPAPSLDIEVWPWSFTVHALGTFSVLRDDACLKTGRKSQHRLLDLFKAVIAFGPDGVSGQSLADALWPDSDGDNARNALQVSLYRLRKLLGRDNALFIQDGKVRLKREICWVDAWAFADKVKRLKMLPVASAEFSRLSIEALHLYRGHLFSRESEHSWILTARERMRVALVGQSSGSATRVDGRLVGCRRTLSERTQYRSRRRGVVSQADAVPAEDWICGGSYEYLSALSPTSAPGNRRGTICRDRAAVSSASFTV